jgi:ubiquilin
MPNPWGASTPTPTNQATGGIGANPFALLMGSTGCMGMPGAGAGAAHNPWANPMMGPNAPNLEATLQMMENPMMQTMMQNMMSNPKMMRMMMDSNPMVQQLCQTNPQAVAILDIQPPGTNSYFKYKFVPAMPATAVGETRQPT